MIKSLRLVLLILPFFLYEMQAEETVLSNALVLRKEIWHTDYSQALKIAQDKNTPLLIVFLGSQWCPWSEKLQKEILQNNAFLKPLQNDCVFLKITFPEFPSETNEYAETKRFQDRYGIKECPLFLLISPQEKEITKIAYLPFEPEEYGSYIKELIFDYRVLEMLMQQKKLKTLEFQQLKNLYQKAEKLSNTSYIEKILQKGLKKDQGGFFLFERYCRLLLEDAVSREEQLKLKNQILSRDPQNQHGTYLKVAMADFEALAHHNKKNIKPLKAIKPLLDYLKQFGSQDAENKWKVEMTLSQYLFSKNLLLEASQHAQASFDAAPEHIKPQLLESLNYIKSHIGDHDIK